MHPSNHLSAPSLSRCEKRRWNSFLVPLLWMHSKEKSCSQLEFPIFFDFLSHSDSSAFSLRHNKRRNTAMVIQICQDVLQAGLSIRTTPRPEWEKGGYSEGTKVYPVINLNKPCLGAFHSLTITHLQAYLERVVCSKSARVQEVTITKSTIRMWRLVGWWRFSSNRIRGKRREWTHIK